MEAGPRPLELTEIAHRDHAICNPLSSAKLDRLVDLLDLPHAAAVLDAGCGKGELLLRVVARYGVVGVGIDRSPVFIDEARTRARERGLGASVRFEPADLAETRLEPGAFAAVFCLGATGAFGGYRRALAALAPLLVPGGLLAIGEGYWRREPDPAYLAVLGATRDQMGSHAGNVAAAEAAGYVPLYAAVSSEDDFDEYEGLYARAVELDAIVRPAAPGVAERLARIRAWRGAYLRWGRDTLGFAVYLLRR